MSCRGYAHFLFVCALSLLCRWNHFAQPSPNSTHGEKSNGGDASSDFLTENTSTTDRWLRRLGEGAKATGSESDISPVPHTQ